LLLPAVDTRMRGYDKVLAGMTKLYAGVTLHGHKKYLAPCRESLVR
jgi:hypothetical protein